MKVVGKTDDGILVNLNSTEFHSLTNKNIKDVKAGEDISTENIIKIINMALWYNHESNYISRQLNEMIKTLSNIQKLSGTNKKISEKSREEDMACGGIL